MSLNWARSWLGKAVVRYLNKPIRRYEPFSITAPERLDKCLQPGDVLLVEGNRRISAIIKYLTQSTWSHAAVYVGPIFDDNQLPDPKVLIEARSEKGVQAVPLSNYRKFNTRICRPIGLTPEDRQAVVEFLQASIGHQYDMRNIVDLFRYLVPYPPVPIRFRRRMLAFGSGDPTRAICSTLIAKAFQSIRYPILPQISREDTQDDHSYTNREIMHIRHHSLFTPRDFDLSPYFAVIKPALEGEFDYRSLVWADPVSGSAEAASE
ncbi:MAG: lipo-like protein [Alphaproteobacteria bacterium]|nr:MAG: lipo-like protein [Alphaproteobacteria bacterium]